VGRFFNGMVVGAAIALLVAPMRGEEMRRLVSERLNNLGVSLPTSSTNSNASVTETLSEAKENVRENLTEPGANVMGQSEVKRTNKPGQSS
jgi:gas vesicle protein